MNKRQSDDIYRDIYRDVAIVLWRRYEILIFHIENVRWRIDLVRTSLSLSFSLTISYYSMFFIHKYEISRLIGRRANLIFRLDRRVR